MRFLRPLECFIGIFHGLLGMLVPGLVIFLPMVRGSCTVRVCGEFVELCSSLVRVIWHSAAHPGNRSILESFHFPNCSIRDTPAARHSYTLSLLQPPLPHPCVFVSRKGGDCATS